MKNLAVHKELSFSVELKSKKYLKNIMLTNGAREDVLIEGVLGKLE